MTKKNYLNKDKPLISIVTVVYNGEEFLEKTILSVLNQIYDNVEYIIIDGGSTDGTVDIIKKYEDKIDYWVSEKDDGIFDAMNKGMDVATGDYVNFMNAGDRFYINNVLEEIVAYIHDENSVYFGRAKLVSKHDTWLRPDNKYTMININDWLKKENPVHQAMFFPKNFYKNESYNLDYSIISDGDYKDRAKQSLELVFIDIIVCEFELGGISSGFDSYKHVRTMMCEAWNIGMEKGILLQSIKRIFIYNIKYFLNMLMGEELFYKIVKLIHKR